MRISDWSSDVCSSDLKTWLDALHADAIAEKSQYQYMYTEGHWWSDRVDQPNETLQRERLGGIALKRNQTYPGNAVSWRFADPDGAVNTAILVPDATRDRFRVQIGRAHVCTPVTHAHLVCRLLLAKKH